jgi:hypothetical protein
MHMGEEGYDLKHMDAALDDTTSIMVTTFYADRNRSQYVRNHYGDPVRGFTRVDTAKDLVIFVTDWDVATESRTAEEATAALSATYGTANTVKKDKLMLYRDKGWNMRQPIALSRTQDYEVYDEFGQFRSRYEYRGNYIFSTDTDLPHSADVLNVYVDQIPFDIAGAQIVEEQAKEIDPPIPAEIKEA